MNYKKALKVAMAAHNKKIHVSMNDNWNAQHNAGLMFYRSICSKIASSLYGNDTTKITMKDAKTWASSLLPPGVGYPSQDCVPGSELDNLRKELLTL